MLSIDYLGGVIIVYDVPNFQLVTAAMSYKSKYLNEILIVGSERSTSSPNSGVLRENHPLPSLKATLRLLLGHFIY